MKFEMLLLELDRCTFAVGVAVSSSSMLVMLMGRHY